MALRDVYVFSKAALRALRQIVDPYEPVPVGTRVVFYDADARAWVAGRVVRAYPPRSETSYDMHDRYPSYVVRGPGGDRRTDSSQMRYAPGEEEGYGWD